MLRFLKDYDAILCPPDCYAALPHGAAKDLDKHRVWGNLYAFDLEGQLQPVFMNSQSSISTGLFSVNGFSYPGMEEMAAKFNFPERFFPQLSTLTLLAGPLVVFLFTILSALYPALSA